MQASQPGPARLPSCHDCPCSLACSLGLQAKGVEFVLPTDVVVADKFAPDANTQVVDVTAIPDGWMVSVPPGGGASGGGASKNQTRAVSRSTWKYCGGARKAVHGGHMRHMCMWARQRVQQTDPTCTMAEVCSEVSPLCRWCSPCAGPGHWPQQH